MDRNYLKEVVRMKASPLFSEGARYQRAVFRNRLRRRIKETTGLINLALVIELDWVLVSQKRYDKAPGGLGKK